MNGKDLFQAGIREYRAGNYEEAGELLQNSLEIDDQNPKAWNSLGIVFTKLGQLDDATTCFENALMLDPGNETYEKNYAINEEKRKKSQNSTNKVKTPPQTTSNSKKKSEAGYIEIIKTLLTNPKEVFIDVESEGWLDSFKFILPLFAIYGVLSGIVVGASTNFLMIFIAIIAIFIGGIIGIFLNAIITHIGVIIFSGGQNSGWEGTFMVVMYSLVPFFLIGWIPIIGQIIGSLLGLFIIITGLKHIHGLSTIRAILSLFGLFILIAIVVVSAAVIAAFVFGMAGSTQSSVNAQTNQIHSITSVPTVATPKNTQISTPIPTPYPTKTPVSSSPITVPYDDLLREPEKYTGKSISISGVVIQAIDDQSVIQSKLGSDGQNIMVLTNMEYAMQGAKSENYFLLCVDRPLGKRIIQGDKISIVFTSKGLYTYQTAEGAIATVPTGIVMSGTINP